MQPSIHTELLQKVCLQHQNTCKLRILFTIRCIIKNKCQLLFVSSISVFLLFLVCQNSFIHFIPEANFTITHLHTSSKLFSFGHTCKHI